MDQFGERSRDTTAGTRVNAEFVVAAPNVLHQRVTADDHSRRTVAFQSANRTQSRLESAVVALDPVVRILLGVMKRGRHEFDDRSP